jgi:V/A-type H+-transporting ATPase subunit D
MTGSRTSKVTRSTLLRLTRRLGQVDKGTALLEKKRDSLVGQLFARVHPTVDARRRIEQQAALAYRALIDALAAPGHADLSALALPGRELRVEALPPEATSDNTTADRFMPPPPLVRSTAARAWVPGQFDASAKEAALAFERLLELVLAAAPEESAIRRLGRELAHTMRQVNVLEQRVAVDLRQSLSRVRRTLDEREREEALRLRRIAAHRRR